MTDDLKNGLEEGLEAATANDPSVQANITALRIQKTLRWLILSTVILVAGFGMVAIYGYKIAQNNTKGLCALRSDAKERIKLNKKFLIKNPKGIPTNSKAVLERSVAVSILTVESLENIECPPTVPIPGQ